MTKKVTKKMRQINRVQQIELAKQALAEAALIGYEEFKNQSRARMTHLNSMCAQLTKLGL